MNESKQIVLLLANGEQLQCSLSISKKNLWEIRLSGYGGDNLTFEDEDLFDALIELRLELEKSGCFLLCNGSRKDVFSSGMSRSMGSGRTAYIIRQGQQVGRDDTVDIFDYTEPQLISTVREQQEYLKEWIESLRKRT